MSTTKARSAAKKTAETAETPKATTKATEKLSEGAIEVATAGRAVADKVGAVSGRAASTAGAAWVQLKARKAIAIAAGAGAAVAGTAAYAVGRRSGRRRRGALSRLTGGRL